MKVVQKFSEISNPTAILYNAKNKQRISLKTCIFSRWQVDCKSILVASVCGNGHDPSFGNGCDVLKNDTHLSFLCHDNETPL